MAILSKLSLTIRALAAVVHTTSSHCSYKHSSHHTGAYDFHQSQAGIQTAQLIDPLPLPYDFNTSNSEMADSSNSWWISSYLTGSDNHQYMVLSHFSEMATQNLTADSQDGKFNIRTDDFFFGSALANNSITRLRTVSNRTDLQFGLTYELTAPVLFNAGLDGRVVHACGKTSGSLVFNVKMVTVDKKRSQTWYDRQWDVGSAPTSLTWTWFQLHINNGESDENELVSLWMYDSDVKCHRQWATTQSKTGINIVQPVPTVEPFGSSWTSPHTNATYDQAWTIVLQENTTLTVKKTYEDQELWAVGGLATYEGFVTVNGTDADGKCVTGFGLVHTTIGCGEQGFPSAQPYLSHTPGG
ncbi:hypothetical protein BDV33DRAFT_193079 [Aspergillus novoparasiticus]|uniref:AttH domain-containing protein n=1 Tax=Aspergillus novoparasiticus TaxID=986946 RepID=A0A5N6ENP6_9EURO|nr:hypothetical protein BDV33DRAFT_193079 [Aspergillus novoparasiticus]